jgi:hypothetical protein
MFIEIFMGNIDFKKNGSGIFILEKLNGVSIDTIYDDGLILVGKWWRIGGKFYYLIEMV